MMISRATSFSVFCLVLLVSRACAQMTINVPADHATIQAAVDVAVTGDTILVAPGNHAGDILVIDKRITLRSSGGAAVTTIQGSGIVTPQRPVIAAHAGNKVIGFTLTGGTGVWVPAGFYNFTPNVFGGGIYLGGGSPGEAVRSELRDCIVTGNAADQGGDPSVDVEGGAVFVTRPADNSPHDFEIVDCVVSNNAATLMPGSIAFSIGGGLLLFDDGIVERCVITDNVTDGSGGGIYWNSASDVSMRDCFVERNHADLGGGLYQFFGAASVERCVFADNVATSFGGGIYARYPSTLRDSLIAGNAAAEGGGVYTWLGITALTIQRCTIASNIASVMGGGLRTDGLSHATLKSSIVWGNAPDQIDTSGGFGVIPSWSDIDGGGFPGAGMINADPLFFDVANRDFRLMATSPCRNTGDPADPGGHADFEGDPRPFDGAVDMGADEFYGLGSCGSSQVTTGMGTVDVLTINGSAGGPARRVVVATGNPFTLAVDQPPLNPSPAPFLISGFIGVPLPAQATALPFGLGMLCFPSALLTPGSPGTFTLTSSYGPIPGELTPSHPAPWSLAGIAPPLDFAIAFQGLITHLPGQPVLTNGIILEFRD